MIRPPTLEFQDVSLAYEQRLISQDLSLSIEAGQFTVIIGPNACGKSTLLRAMARLLRPQYGSVLLAGEDIRSLRTRTLATRLGLLPQSAVAPEGITVGELVARGRFPHQSVLSRWSAQDQQKVEDALRLTHLTELSERPVDELSGGQRQRAWAAMAIAQDTDVLLLDEPTTYLDLAHQISLLDLFADLNTSTGQTIVAVLHDLNQALRYAGHLIVLKDGRVVAQGRPSEIVAPDLVLEVFGVESGVIEDPVNGGLMVVPRHGTPVLQTPTKGTP